MVSKGVIQEFITDINFRVLGYRIYYIFTKPEGKNSGNTKDHNNRRIVIEHLNRLGDIIADIEVDIDRNIKDSNRATIHYISLNNVCVASYYSLLLFFYF
jgi:hypothetical protein